MVLLRHWVLLAALRTVWRFLAFGHGAAFLLLDRVSRFRRRAPSKTVAIVIPVSDRAWLTPDEEISLAHLRRHLAPYDKFLIAPKGLNLRLDGMRTIELSRKYFGSVYAHNHLLYWLRFWEQFREYKYIFIYHLDALVFRDELLMWCATDVDYIGPPFLHCDDSPWVTRPRVGNGGFSLVKVDSIIRVLRARYRKEPHKYWSDVFTRNRHYLEPQKQLARVVARARETTAEVSGRCETARDEPWNGPSDTDVPYDIFWSDRAVEYVSDFKVASFEEGLRFAFEVAPRTCYALNGYRLPFGCHAFGRYDRSFWEPYLLYDGRLDSLGCAGATSEPSGGQSERRN
jgi:hypothetical protein